VHGSSQVGPLISGLVVAGRLGCRGGAVVGGPGGRGSGLVLLVGENDVGGLRRGDPGIQRPDDHHRQGAAHDLGGDEGQHRGGQCQRRCPKTSGPP
jgi:hypothetical protein